jgi:hypothetical protein
MKHRDLRLELMRGYHRRGRLLSEIRHLVPLSTAEHACIALYTHWEAFVRAEQWNHARQQSCPGTPSSALQLILRWQAAGKPTVFRSRVGGAVWYVRKQTKIGVFYLSLIGQMVCDAFGVIEDVGFGL